MCQIKFVSTCGRLAVFLVDLQKYNRPPSYSARGLFIYLKANIHIPFYLTRLFSDLCFTEYLLCVSSNIFHSTCGDVVYIPCYIYCYIKRLSISKGRYSYKDREEGISATIFHGFVWNFMSPRPIRY